MCYGKTVSNDQCVRVAYHEARKALMMLERLVTDPLEFTTLEDVRGWVRTALENLDDEHPPTKLHDDAACFCTGGDDFCAPCADAGCGEDGGYVPCRVSGKVLPRTLPRR